MRKIIFIFIVVLVNNLTAQIDVLRLNELDYESLKKTTTYLILPEYESEKKQEYIDVLSKVWNFTNLKVITFEEASKINMDDVNISKFEPVVEKNYYDGPTNLSYKYIFSMNYISFNGKGSLTEKEVASINFCVSKESNDMFKKLHNKPLEEQQKFVIDSNFSHNSALGFLKNFIQCVEYNLFNNKGEQRDKSKLVNLEETEKFGKTDTLFIPDYITLFPFSQVDEALSKAKFNYKIISTKELNQKILKSQNDFYYLNFVVNKMEKTINVVKAKDGLFILNNWNPIGLKLKNLTLIEDDVHIIGKKLKSN